jgi:small GTP-binding protein
MPLKLAIVGRPNVGKSTLFNRLAGKKLAIVDDQPGVTRDRRYASGRLGDLDLELIDTAGFEDVSDESLEARMRAQTELAVEEADVSLFIYDAREGVTPLDEVFATLLRRRGKPVIIAANKAEGKAGQSGIGEAYKLGLGEPIPISGEHGEGMAELYAAMLVAFPEDQYFRRRGRRRQADPHRHRRPPERRQVDPDQPPDRRAAPADRSGGRHHPRLDLGRLGGTAEGPPGRHRRPAQEGQGAGEAGKALHPTPSAPSPSPRSWCW